VPDCASAAVALPTEESTPVVISEINLSILKEEGPDVKRPSTGRKQPRKAWGVEEVAIVAPLKMEEEEEKEVVLRRPATS